MSPQPPHFKGTHLSVLGVFLHFIDNAKTAAKCQ